MEKIFSKVDGRLLHFVIRDEDFKNGRQDLIDVEHFIQCSILQLDKGTTFKPHRHIWKWRKRATICQESWIVIRGMVQCTFYDLNNEIIAQPILGPGDISFTLEGGHNYLILADNTRVAEYKVGPYEGQKLDKEFI
jgi:hypothetical protein